MSTEDKIAAIRREVEERFRAAPMFSGLAELAGKGVVIYGVPLDEREIAVLTAAVSARAEIYSQNAGGLSEVILAMLERGKK